MKKSGQMKRMIKRYCRKRLLAIPAVLIAIIIVFAALPVMNAAQLDGKDSVFDPFAEGASYSFMLYNNTNGLPTSEANAITQTSEGFIWIGSYGGLVRYDGNRFDRMDSSLGVSGVVSLFADKKDRLWLGSNDSGLTMLHRTDILHWGTEEGLKSLAVNSIIEDPKGTIYIGTKDGLFSIEDDMKTNLLTDERIIDSNIIDMKLGSDGLVYCLSDENDLFTLKNREIVQYYPGDTIPTPVIRCMLPDKNRPGYIYFGSDEGIYYCNMNDTPSVVKTITDDALTLIEILTYINGRVWACASDNVVSLFGNDVRVLEGIPMNNKVNSIIQDYEGNLWLSSTRQGVLKITPNMFTDLYLDYQLPSAVVNSTCIYDEKLFICTDTGLTVVDENDALDSLALKEPFSFDGEEYTDLIDMLKAERIRSLIKDSKDRLWISTFNYFGLLCYDHGIVKAYGTENGLISNKIRTVCEMKDGSVAVATNDGVSIVKDDKVEHSYGKDDGLDNTVILTVAEGKDGEILAGSNGGGIYAISENGVDTLRLKDGLSSDTILRLKRDHKRDIVWIVSSNSIGYMTPDHQITTINSFPYTNNFDFVQNSADEMWILSSNGIYVTQTDAMLENGEIDPAHYSIANGLACTATANSYSGLSDNGNFYLSGNTGVVQMNIESGYDVEMDYKVSVPYIEVDDKLQFPDEDGNFTIPSDTETLTIYAFVFNYSLMTQQVSYCLEGFTDRYTTVSREELVPIDYTNLHGGEYHFVMKVTDSRTKKEKTVTVKIVKEKAFYEQIWFIVVSGIALILLLAAILRGIYLSKINRMQQKHREEVEKERITTELNTARNIQQGMLPSDFPDRAEYDLYASMTPAKDVGGDFYDYFPIDDDRLCLVIADVSGKGIPAALFMMATMIIIRNNAKMGKSPAEILSTANEQICANNRAEMFITAWLGILEISTGKLTAANAGHEYPVLTQEDGSFGLYKDKHGFVLGGMEGIRYRQCEIQLKPGDKLFLYTDGVPEASDISEELFGTDRMLAALNECADKSPKEILKAVREAVDRFVKDAEQFDDLTMLCLEYKGDSDESENK